MSADKELQEVASSLSLSTGDESVNTYDNTTSLFRDKSHACCYQMEKIPLAVKLILVTVASMLGLLAFSIWLLSAQGTTLNQSINSQAYREYSTIVQQTAGALQDERDYTSLAMSLTNMTEHGTKNLPEIRKKVDTLVTKVVELNGKFPNDPQIVTFSNAFKPFVAFLPFLRSQTTNSTLFGTNYVPNTILETFSTIIQKALEVSMIACFKLTNPASCVNYVFTGMIEEQSSIFRSYSMTIINGTTIVSFLRSPGEPLTPQRPQGRNNTNFQNNRQFFGVNPTMKMNSALQRQNTLLALLFGVLQDEDYQYVNQSLTNNIITATDALQATLSSSNTSSAVIPYQIYDQLSQRIAVYDVIIDKFLNDYTTSAKSSYDSAIALIIIILVCVIFCIIFACFSSFCFSQTITGPWRRMNKLQEETIAKFVPKDLLFMMKVKSIINLPYGKVCQVHISLVQTEIKNYANLVERMTPEEQYAFLNAFLNDVGPILRQFDGIIVRYLANGFVAAFRNPKKAVKASIELQRHMPQYNKNNPKFPGITLQTGIITDNVLIGTVGEALRMEVAISGTAMNMVRKIKKANDLYKTRILTTSDTISKFKSKKSHYRLIGRINESGKMTALYEILDGRDEVKMQTAVEFTKAVECLFAHQFEEARLVLEKLLAVNNNDAPIVAQLQICNTLISEAKEGSLSVEISQVLQDKTLQEAFSKYCDQELSFENMLVWRLIQSYKVASPVERKQIVQLIV